MIAGLSVGMESTGLPIIIISIGLLCSYDLGMLLFILLFTLKKQKGKPQVYKTQSRKISEDSLEQLLQQWECSVPESLSYQ